MKTSRPPIVCILGHVDHGKTSLLDAIRQTNIASREKGGITQGIGASLAKSKSGKLLTFIDTPGHAAFSQMRSRGAKVSDIALLAVSSDDGVMPQTKEALKFIKEAQIPFIVVLTKIDLPTANIEIALGQLEKEEVFFEGRGGDVPFCKVSSKTGEGLEDLLELIVLLSEVNEILGDKDSDLESVVIETSKEKSGPLATVVVRNGTLKVGQTIYSGNLTTKVRGLFDSLYKPVKEILPGFPGAILGFSELPFVGSVITDSQSVNSSLGNSPKDFERIKVASDEIAVFLKTKTAGSLEALIASMPEKIKVVGFGVGDVNESDVLYAKNTGCSNLLVFEAKVPNGVSKLAETEGIKIKQYGIIYELINDLEERITQGKEVVLGTVEIIAIFPYEKTRVAGCKVINGEIKKSDLVYLERKGARLGRVKLTSMRKAKSEVTIAKQGEELGIIFDPQFAFDKGDMLLSVAK